MKVKQLKTKTIEDTSPANLDAAVQTFLATLVGEPALVSVSFFFISGKYVCFIAYAN